MTIEHRGLAFDVRPFREQEGWEWGVPAMNTFGVEMNEEMAIKQARATIDAWVEGLN
ncbi:MAG TPA: hypothetical protein VGC77_09300 [Rhodopseudomonas sp.]|uniref:hypothetical protein n=1 Tax=Rhodopseudomonas sp. TaxID=1078 RepID=UPI002ED7A859